MWGLKDRRSRGQLWEARQMVGLCTETGHYQWGGDSRF